MTSSNWGSLARVAAGSAIFVLFSGFAEARDASFYAPDFSKLPRPAAMTALGRTLFMDPALSASGKQACASCHDPARAYGPPNGLAVQLGGTDLKQAGVRAVPSLRYLQLVPPFSEHRFDEAIDESVDQGPSGGHTWDGRADTVHDQARLPLLSPFEMANASPAAVVARVEHASYAQQFRDTFGDDVFATPERGFHAVLMALEVFQQSPKDFYPYDSKYDGWLRGRLKLDEREARGLALFNDPRKGNCASCHPSQVRNGAFPQFTDYGYIALGAPRNPRIPANRDANWHDLGLCGPLRTEFSSREDYCGLFRAPSLRNVTLRHRFFHNGVFSSLRQVLRFYVGRDRRPQDWYPHGQAYDDLPAAYQHNLYREAPFGTRGAALSEAEIADVERFLGTLKDGYGVAAVAGGGR